MIPRMKEDKGRPIHYLFIVVFMLFTPTMMILTMYEKPNKLESKPMTKNAKSPEEYNLKHTNSENLTYTSLGTVEKIIDGDTLRLSKLDFGNGLILENQVVRFAGINTPELKKEEREAGLLVRRVLILMIGSDKVWIKSVSKRDSFGRMLANLYTTKGVQLNSQLIKMGLAKKYEKGVHFSKKELESVIEKANKYLNGR